MEACAINSFDVDLEFGTVSIVIFQLVEHDDVSEDFLSSLTDLQW